MYTIGKIDVYDRVHSDPSVQKEIGGFGFRLLKEAKAVLALVNADPLKWGLPPGDYGIYILTRNVPIVRFYTMILERSDIGERVFPRGNGGDS